MWLPRLIFWFIHIGHAHLPDELSLERVDWVRTEKESLLWRHMRCRLCGRRYVMSADLMAVEPHGAERRIT